MRCASLEARRYAELLRPERGRSSYGSNAERHGTAARRRRRRSGVDRARITLLATIGLLDALGHEGLDPLDERLGAGGEELGTEVGPAGADLHGGQPSADAGRRLQDDDARAARGQLLGGDQTGEAGADDQDGFAVVHHGRST